MNFRENLNLNDNQKAICSFCGLYYVFNEETEQVCILFLNFIFNLFSKNKVPKLYIKIFFNCKPICSNKNNCTRRTRFIFCFPFVYFLFIFFCRESLQSETQKIGYYFCSKRENKGEPNRHQNI